MKTHGNFLELKIRRRLSMILIALGSIQKCGIKQAIFFGSAAGKRVFSMRDVNRTTQRMCTRLPIVLRTVGAVTRITSRHSGTGG